MLKFGRIYAFKSRSPKECIGCKLPISRGEIYIRRVGLSGANQLFASLYHTKCLHAEIDAQIEDLQLIDFDRRNNRKARTTPQQRAYRRGHLTPEQVKRRETLLLYLNTRGRDRLLKAYKTKNTLRVFEVMGQINRWLVELQSMGVPFSRGFINRTTELKELIIKHDSQWFNDMAQTEDINERWGKFIRSIKDEYQPTWDSDE